MVKRKVPPDNRAEWGNIVPVYDDFGDEIENVFINGATVLGKWAIMTPKNHKIYGRGLGPGCGQRFLRQRSGRWIEQNLEPK